MDAYIWGFTEKYRVFKGIDEESDHYLESKALYDFKGEWKCPDIISSSARSKKKKLGDFPATDGFCHLVSHKAANVLENYFLKTGELLDVNILDDDVHDKYFLFRCNNVLDCLDINESEIKYSPIRPGVVSSIVRPVFLNTNISSEGFFVVEENPGGDIYVTENVRNIVEAMSLKGMVLSRGMFDDVFWIS